MAAAAMIGGHGTTLGLLAVSNFKALTLWRVAQAAGGTLLRVLLLWMFRIRRFRLQSRSER